MSAIGSVIVMGVRQPFSPGFPDRPGLRRSGITFRSAGSPLMGGRRGGWTGVTRRPWTRREAHRGEPCPGCTPGTGRTCGTPSAAGRTAGSACRPARRTSASGPPSGSAPSWPCSVLLEREAQELEQRPALVVGLGGGDHRDVHASGPVDPVLIDLMEHRLLGQTERVVAVPVELAPVQAAEVTDTRQRDGQQPVQELPHPVAPEGDLGADRHTLAQLELRDGLRGAAYLRLLAGDRGQVAYGAVDELGVLGG